MEGLQQVLPRAAGQFRMVKPYLSPLLRALPQGPRPGLPL